MTRKQFFKRFTERSRAFSARNAAEGTYETIRQAIIYGRPASREDADEQVLARLATRRSWKRMVNDTFIVRRGTTERSVTVTAPLDIATFFRDVIAAEIDVFCAGATDLEMARLQETGRGELRRLFARDGLPRVE